MSVAIESPWKTTVDRDLERIEKRDAVLRTAARAFCENGVRATSLVSIAEQLNVTKPTLYRYFRNKDEILAECVLIGLRMIDGAIADATAQRLSALDRLRAALRRYGEIMTMDYGICVTRIAETELSPAGRRVFRAEKRKIDTRLRGLIEDCMAEGSIRAGDVRLMTSTVAGALNWIARWYDPSGPLAPRQIAGQVVDILLDGLSARPTHVGQG